MEEKNWLMVNVCQNKCSVWVISDTSGSIDQKFDLHTYARPTQRDNKKRIDLAFFEDEEGKWHSYVKGYESAFKDYQLIPALMEQKPENKYLRILHDTLGEALREYKSLPLVFLTDQQNWISDLRSYIQKVRDLPDSQVYYVPDSFSGKLSGYALLNLTDELPKAGEKLYGFLSDSSGRKMLECSRQGLYFQIHETQSDPAREAKNLASLGVEDEEDLHWLGTALFYLIWRPRMETTLQQEMDRLMENIKQKEGCLTQLQEMTRKLRSLGVIGVPVQ